MQNTKGSLETEIRSVRIAQNTLRRFVSKSYARDTITIMTKTTTIVIPAYNEEVGIHHILDLVTRLEKNDYEIIVVDDGSTDNTYSVASSYNDVTVISHPRNIGYGAAIKTGIKKAQGTLIAIIDADGTYPANKIPELVAYAHNMKCDMVIGARDRKSVNIPSLRKPAKWVLSVLAEYLTSTKIPDLNSGLRVFKKDIVKQFDAVLSNQFSFTTTITLAMLSHGCTVAYIPVEYENRKGDSKIRPIRDTIRFVELIIRTTVYFRPLRVFMPASTILFLIGFLMLLYRIFVAEQFGTTIALFFLAAFQMFSIGLVAELINVRMSTFKNDHYDSAS